ncbi:uncharacterized protein F5891DRAFT_1195661 [Suillus fuscotomentosus]|uniref:Uncharacterized protein n=1 Tax=Suillus fuscotomentosus TaxID=1912939 RepID=A0AAD4HF07_9AGAM|nr:uncharacterized protein F5891DRAFT_1195661 [Suillus fuscotomentosus]KAG1894102.1 hypothetical protein F5891DRAFT_1195661 [Suillus fuscotomentosus]
MATMFGSTSPSFYCTRTTAKKTDIKTLNDDKKMTPSETPTSAGLKTNGTKPKSRVKAQSLSLQAPSLNTTTTDVIARTAQIDDSEAELQAIRNVLEGLENITVSSDPCNETILDSLQQVQIEPICFYNGPYQEFAIVLDAISMRSDFLYCLAKMTYFPQMMTLIIYSLHPIHDQMTSEIASAVSSALRGISYKRSLLMINVIPGRISSKEIFTIPDLQITLTTTKRPSATQVLWYVETAFTQTKCMVLGKIEKVIASHHEVACVLFILISEHSKYKSPADDSATYGEALADKAVRPYTFFAPEREPDKLFGLVHTMDYTWIDVSKIEYFVWIKPDDRPIDIKFPHTAYGTIFPNLNMDQINDALNIGLDKVRAEMTNTLDFMEPGVDHHHVLTPSSIAFDRDSDLTYMSVSIYRTAHFRYCDWYHRQFTGTKHCRATSGAGRHDANSERPSTRWAILSEADEERPSTSGLASSSGSTSTSTLGSTSASTLGSSVDDGGVSAATTSIAVLSAVVDDNSTEMERPSIALTTHV